MRLAALFGLVLAIGLAVAAPAPAPPSPTAPRMADGLAERYTDILLQVIEQIVKDYVRPVEREELLFASLAGLYEDARLPVPPHLRKECTAIGSRAGKVDAGVPTGLAVGDLKKLIRRVYVEVAAADNRHYSLPDGWFTTTGISPDKIKDALQAARVRQFIVISARAMTRILDPFSGVITAEEYRRHVGDDNESERLGLELRDNLVIGPTLVGDVQPGGPAQRAGLRPGDAITHLDGKTLEDTPDASVRLRLIRPPEQILLQGQLERANPELPKLALTYRRAGKNGPVTVDLYREAFHTETVFGMARREDNSWNFFVDRPRGLAHVRLGSLAKGTTDELRGVVAKLQEEGLRGLILDLRWAPGGFLLEATECAGLFLGEATVATIKSRNRPDTVHRSAGDGKFTDFPMVVLINGETSGGAELIAAALQDHKRAVLVGQRTRGKGSIQISVYLGIEGIGMKLTNGTFRRPSGKSLHRFPDSKAGDDWGVRPDPGHEFRISADLNRTLAEWWQAQILRPGTSRERLPLDDPSADPPALRALEVLRERVADATIRK